MLQPVAYQQLFRTLGYQIRLFRAVPCECVNNKDGYDDHYDCTVPGCIRGYVYREETLATGVRVGLTIVKQMMIHPEFGALLAGDVLLTSVPSDVLPLHLDRVLLMGFEHTLVEQVTKGSDTLIHPFATSVRQVRTTSTVYVPSTSYMLSVDSVTGASRIVWASAPAPQPATGAYYSVSYSYHPFYWVDGTAEEGGSPTLLTNAMSLPRTVKLAKERPTNDA